MRLHLLGCELLVYLAGRLRPQVVDVKGGCLGDYSETNSWIPAGCLLRLPPGAHTVDLQLRTVGAAPASPPGDDAMEEVDAISSAAGYVVDGRKGQVMRKPGFVGWSGLRVSALAARTVDFWWCEDGAAPVGREPISEVALRGSPGCNVRIQLTLQQCVWLSQTETWQPRKNVEAATGEAMEEDGRADPVLHYVRVRYDERPGQENVAAKRPEPLPTESPKQIFVRRHVAQAREAADEQSEAADERDEQEARKAAVNGWRDLEKADKKPFGRESQAQKDAQAVQTTIFERQLVMFDYHRLLPLSDRNPPRGYKTFIRAADLQLACFPHLHGFSHGWLRLWSEADAMKEGVTYLNFCTGLDLDEEEPSWISGRLRALLGLAKPSMACKPEAWVHVGIAVKRLQSGTGEDLCGLRQASTAQMLPPTWWAPHVGCVDMGCVYEETAVALQTCERRHGSTDCARMRAITAKCSSSRQCHLDLFGGSPRAFASALRIAQHDYKKPAQHVQFTRQRRCAGSETTVQTILQQILVNYFMAHATATPFRVFNPANPLLEHEVWTWDANPSYICDQYWRDAKSTTGARVSKRRCEQSAADLAPSFAFRKELPCACAHCHAATCMADEFNSDFACEGDEKVTNKYKLYMLRMQKVQRMDAAAVVPRGRGDATGRPLHEFVRRRPFPEGFHTLIIIDVNGVLAKRVRDGKMGVTYFVNPFAREIIAAATAPLETVVRGGRARSGHFNFKKCVTERAHEVIAAPRSRGAAPSPTATSLRAHFQMAVTRAGVHCRNRSSSSINGGYDGL